MAKESGRTVAEWSLFPFRGKASSTHVWVPVVFGLGALFLGLLALLPAFREWLSGLVLSVVTVALVIWLAFRGGTSRRRKR
jgi:membrane protein implicated in regulation of membrane protease activity